MSQQEKRGSDALIEAYRAGGFTIDEDLIKRLVRVIDGHRGPAMVDHVLIKGQPRPDVLNLALSVKGIPEAGALVNETLGAFSESSRAPGSPKVPGSVHIFSRGIPWPDEFVINIVVAEEQHF